MTKNTKYEKQFCPIVKPIELIGDMWTLLIIKSLYNESKRYNEIKKAIPEINNRTLSLRLKKMADLGIIQRSVDNQINPPLVTYKLTSLGCGIKPIIDQIELFGNKFLC